MYSNKNLFQFKIFLFKIDLCTKKQTTASCNNLSTNFKMCASKKMIFISKYTRLSSHEAHLLWTSSNGNFRLFSNTCTSKTLFLFSWTTLLMFLVRFVNPFQTDDYVERKNLLGSMCSGKSVFVSCVVWFLIETLPDSARFSLEVHCKP